MATEAKAVTAEDLMEKLEEKRQALAASKAAEETASAPTSIQQDDYFTPVERMDQCVLCRREFTYNTIAGATVRRRTCDACLEQRERDELERRQQVDEAKAEAVRIERAARVLDLIEAAGVNVAEHRDATLDSFDATEAGSEPLQLARRFTAAALRAGKHDPVRGLYLHGSTGTGKTHLAVGVLRQLLADASFPENGVVYDHAAMLMARIQDTYNTKSSTLELLERRFAARVWILDDLGTERASADVAQHLTLIFTMRAMRPTLVTSNLSPDEFEAKRPELARVVSRLGPAYFRVEQVGGRDRRFG